MKRMAGRSVTKVTQDSASDFAHEGIESDTDWTSAPDANPRLPKFFKLLIPLVGALADLEGSAKASDVISKMIADSGKTRRSSKLFMQIHEARTFLTKAGYLVCPQRGIWELTDKGRVQPIRPSDLPKIHRQNRGWRSYWFDEQQSK